MSFCSSWISYPALCLMSYQSHMRYWRHWYRCWKGHHQISPNKWATGAIVKDICQSGYYQDNTPLHVSSPQLLSSMKLYISNVLWRQQETTFLLYSQNFGKIFLMEKTMSISSSTCLFLYPNFYSLLFNPGARIANTSASNPGHSFTKIICDSFIPQNFN